MLHTLKYNIIALFRNKTLIFWTYIFPIVLALLFNLAFSNIEKDELFKTIDIGIVNNEEYKNNSIYKETFKSLSENETFNIKYDTKNNLEKELESDSITGYLLIENDKPKLVFNSSGMNQTIFKFVVDEIEETKKTINNVIMLDQSNIEKTVNEIVDKINNSEVKINNISSNNISYTVIEYFSLIGMACLYGSMIGIQAINQCLANMSSKGKRVSISPTKKSLVVLSSAIASYIVSLVGLAILILFLTLILKIDFGCNILYIILVSLVGTLAGISFGTLIASTFKVSDNSKIGIALSFSMLGSVLAGMMGVMLKYVVDKNIPILNRLNPTNMITDAFYSLYYYDTLDRFYMNIISLLVFSIICIIISYFSIRRQKYDSI